jgi:Family of unknown function (DUF6441)
MKLNVDFDQAAWLKMSRQMQQAIATAATGALQQTAVEAVAEARTQIASAGQFSKWQKGLTYRMEAGPPPTAIILHKAAIAGVFEFGATIHGKPLMWIPTAGRGPRAGILRKRGIKLTSATIHGRPVLFDARDPDPHRKPLYIGVPVIRIPKKWRVTEIVKEHAKQLAQLFFHLFKPD